MTRLSKPLIKIKQISFIFNTTEIIMSIYVSANYNYRIEENVNFYLKMNYTSKTEDAVCRQYPSLCASAGITFSFPDKRLQLNIACSVKSTLIGKSGTTTSTTNKRTMWTRASVLSTWDTISTKRHVRIKSRMWIMYWTDYRHTRPFSYTPTNRNHYFASLPQPVCKDKYTVVHLIQESPYPLLNAFPIYSLHINKTIFVIYTQANLLVHHNNLNEL